MALAAMLSSGLDLILMAAAKGYSLEESSWTGFDLNRCAPRFDPGTTPIPRLCK